MLGMASFAQSEVIKLKPGVPQHCLNENTPVEMRPMCAPSRDNAIRFGAGLQNSRVIRRPDRILRGPHRFGIRVPPCKDVGDREAAEPQGPRAPLAAFHRGIILDLGRG